MLTVYMNWRFAASVSLSDLGIFISVQVYHIFKCILWMSMGQCVTNHVLIARINTAATAASEFPCGGIVHNGPLFVISGTQLDSTRKVRYNFVVHDAFTLVVTGFGNADSAVFNAAPAAITLASVTEVLSADANAASAV